MARLTALALFAAALARPALAADAPAVQRNYKVTLRVVEGDPLGSRAAGTQKLLSEPVLMTHEGRPGCFLAGRADKPLSRNYQITVTPGKVGPDGKLAVEVEIGKYTLSGETPAAKATVVRTDTVTKGMSVFFGSTEKVRVGEATATYQTWVEFTIEDVSPDAK